MTDKIDENLTPVSWETKLKAFLHDPPDKSLCISGHIIRSKHILNAINISDENNIVKKADEWASSIQRISWKYEGKEPLIDFCEKKWNKVEYMGKPILKHTLSGKTKDYENLNKDHLTAILDIEKESIKSTEKEDIKNTYFYTWRYLKEKLHQNIEGKISKEVADEFINLPADTRIPDHTIWDHNDIVSAIYGAMEKGKPALLMFKISPVQSFIVNSRKEEDLWAGSHILSYLTYQGIKEIVEIYGHDALIYPYLRGLPLVDNDYFEIDNKELLGLATIPNKFLAIVSINDVEALKNKIHDSIMDSWNELAKTVEINVDNKDEFNNQIGSQWNITIKALEFPDNPSKFIEENKNNIPSDVFEKYNTFIKSLKDISSYKLKPIDNYGLIFELLQSIVDYESKHKINTRDIQPKNKCTMCGEKVSITNNTSKLKKGEELCGICLIKRHYRKFVKKEFDIEIKTKSVSEIAMRKGDFIEKVKKTDEYNKVKNKFNKIFYNEWDEEYIYKICDDKIDSIITDIKESLDEKLCFDESYFDNISDSMKKLKNKIKNENFGMPPTYYGILVMDGDNMGMKLVGDDLKNFKEYLHPNILNKIPDDEKYKNIFDKKRRLTPTIHTAISRALTEFALKDVVTIVNDCKGELIYTGGDDVLALLPIDTILECANNIQKAFQKDFDGWNQYPYGKMSAGIMIVKYNYPLYDALKRARGLEKKAKNEGRNRFYIGFLKGSQMYETGAKWEILDDDLTQFVEYIDDKTGISPKFIYDFIKMASNLKNLDNDAFKSLLKFEIKRHSSKDFKHKMTEQKGEKWIEETVDKLAEKSDNKEGYFSLAILLKILFEMRR